VTDFMVALELACHRRGNARVRYLDEILATHAPATARNSPRPYMWPVTVRWRGRDTTIYLCPDRIFEIELLDMPERSRHKFFFFENDTGKMPVMARRFNGSSLRRKLIAYGHSFRAGLHTKVYGFSNVRVLTATHGQKRIENVQAAYMDHCSKLCSPKIFLFADRPSFLSADHFLDYQWADAAGNHQALLG
jgi:hypothetical protein